MQEASKTQQTTTASQEPDRLDDGTWFGVVTGLWFHSSRPFCANNAHVGRYPFRISEVADRAIGLATIGCSGSRAPISGRPVIAGA
jgi:hypothetical protein